MGNFVIGYDNKIDTATLSGGSWVVYLPLTNLQDDLQGLVARSSASDDGSTWFVVDLGQDTSLRVFAIVAHNMGLDDSFRIRGAYDGDEALADPCYDSGWLDAYPAVYDTEDLEWEDDNFWSGQPSAAERAPLNPTRVVSTAAAVAPRYVRVDFNVTANADGYIQLGRFFLGPGLSPEIGASFGHGIRFSDPSSFERTISGALVANKLPKLRVATLRTDWLTETEALGFVFRIQGMVGITDEVVYQRDPEDTIQALNTQFMGRLATLDNISNPSLNVYGAGWEIEERR